MSGQDKNKREQNFHLERFAESYAEFPSGIRDYGDKPDDIPDLIVHAPEGLIGIEHTRLFQASEPSTKRSMKSEEALQDQIVAKAHEAYQAAGGRPAYLSTYFDDRVPLRKGEVLMYSAKLVEAMRFAESKGIDGRIENWAYNERFPNGLPAGIHSLTFNFDSKPDWDVVRTACIPSLTQQRIQAKIDDKEKRLDDYHTRCNQLGVCYQVWLLIVCDLAAPSSHFELPDDVRTASYKSTFDQVFLMRLFSNSIVPQPSLRDFSSEVPQQHTLLIQWPVAATPTSIHGCITRESPADVTFTLIPEIREQAG